MLEVEGIILARLGISYFLYHGPLFQYEVYKHFIAQHLQMHYIKHVELLKKCIAIDYNLSLLVRKRQDIPVSLIIIVILK